MIKINPNFVIGDKGEKKGVFLSMKDFEKIMEELEEFEDTKAAIKAKESKNTSFITLDELKENYYKKNGQLSSNNKEKGTKRAREAAS